MGRRRSHRSGRAGEARRGRAPGRVSVLGSLFLALVNLGGCRGARAVVIETSAKEVKAPTAPIVRSRDATDGRGVYGRYGYAPGRLGQYCQAGDPSACNDLGYLTESGNQVNADARLAAQYYHKACEQGAGAACNNLGLLFRSTRYGAPDPQRGLRLIEKACDAGEQLACRNLGWLFLNKSSSALSRSEGMRLLTKSCAGGLVTACGDLGLLSVRGVGVPWDERYGAIRLQDACSRGSAKSCGDLGMLKLTAVTLERSGEQALPLLEYACSGGILDACSALGALLAQSTEPGRRARGLQLMQRACEAPLGATCSDWAMAHAEGWGMPKSPDRAYALFLKACKAHEPPGCAGYAELVMQGFGSMAANPERAVQIFSKACNEGSFRACYGVGAAMLDGRGIAQQVAEAVPYLRYACGYRYAPACDRLAGVLDSGEAGTNLAEAVSFSDFACTQGIAASCVRLARYYEQGVAVGRDLQRSAALLARACELGEQTACRPDQRQSASPGPDE